METKSMLNKVNLLLVGSVVLLIGIIITGSSLLFKGSSAAGADPAAVQTMTQAELIRRGEYLVNTSACHDCHSPKVMTPTGPEPDPNRLLSGHPADMPLPQVNKEAMKDWILFNQHLTAAAGPWGVTFSANLTSDETGIGNWTEEQFFRAIREGKYKGLEGSRQLLPPMPWQMFRNMTDADLRAIFAYLKSTKPVRNIVPAPIAPPDIQ